MAIYHLSIKIISRAGGRSAIAAAAYRSGEHLVNEETGIIHDFSKKGGVVYSEIMLPENAPAEYLNRERLWNDVQRQEKRSDARFAREVEVALPVEWTREQQIEYVRDFIKENFVDVGMIADWALHDKGDGNPHAHIMLTVRGFTEEQKWDAKKRSVFANDRDEQGRPIYNPDKPSYAPKNKEETAQYRIPQLDANGQQKFRERKGKGREMLWERIDIPANDWDDRANAEKWRASWAETCNKHLAPEQQIDHRSYKRQGIDKEPTIHEGVTARKIEKDGNVSDRMEINRAIRERNDIRARIKKIAEEITKSITEKARAIYERFIEFTRNFGYSERPRRDDGNIGKPTDGDRESDGTGGRINNIKRTVDDAGRELQESIEEIERTERKIAETDRRIAELQELTHRKERERNERLERLKARRNAEPAGTDAGRDRQPENGTESGEREELRAFIAEVDAERRNIETAEKQSIVTEEQRRLAEQQRLEEQARTEKHTHHIR